MDGYFVNLGFFVFLFGLKKKMHETALIFSNKYLPALYGTPRHAVSLCIQESNDILYKYKILSRKEDEQVYMVF